MADIAVVGLGAMGSRIARRFIDAGHDVIVWNRDSAKAEGFPQRAATPADAAERADVVIIMVSDPAALAAVSKGIAAGARAGSTVVQMSTVGVTAVQRLNPSFPTASHCSTRPSSEVSRRWKRDAFTSLPAAPTRSSHASHRFCRRSAPSSP